MIISKESIKPVLVSFWFFLVIKDKVLLLLFLKEFINSIKKRRAVEKSVLRNQLKKCRVYEIILKKS